MEKRLLGVIAGLVAAVAAAAPAAAGPTVTVRVEGERGTLLERSAVTLPDTAGPVCPASSAGAALDLATGGNWNREPFASTILGESHTFTASDYWAEWIDRGAGYRRGAGLCDDALAAGDELLMLVDVPPYSEGSTTEVPLDLEGVPAAVQVGRPLTVTVVGYATDTQYGDIGDGDRVLVGGATVSGGGVSAATGPDGRATLTFSQPGPVVLKGSKAGSVVSAGERLSVSVEPVAAPSAPGASGALATARDTTAPRPAFTGLAMGRRFAHGKGPRLLAGTVAADPSGLRSVKLSLTRERGGKSWYFSGRSERFRRLPRGRSVFFAIGDRQQWSYLLPHRLGPGRYTVAVAATDNAGNRAATKVVIRVR